MSGRPKKKPGRRPPALQTSGRVALYLMSDYTRGIRRPGNYHVIHFEDGHSEQLNRFVPHRHDFFEIIWLRSGRGHVQSDLHSYPVGPGTLFFTSPGQVHAWELEGAARGEIASFTEEFFAVSGEHPGLLGKMPFLYSSATQPILHLDRAEGARVDRVFRQLHEDANDPAPGRDDLVRAYLVILLTMARQFYSRRAANPDASAGIADLLARRFRFSLEENFPRLLEVGEYARLLGVSRTHLNERLHRELGRTASEIIHERIVLEAKRLLAHTTLTSAEIAHQLRFQDPSYFGRFFRRSAGQTPGEYRHRAQSAALAN